MGYPTYSISDDGVLLNRHGRRISLRPNRFGYHTAHMHPGDRTVQIHRLVLEAFVGPCPEGMECRHLDGDGTNNRLENLAWGTPKENSADRRRHGTQVCGNQLSPLTNDDVLAIIQDGRTNADIAATYGVNHQTIASIKAREAWTWLTVGRDIVPSPMERPRLSDDLIARVAEDGRSSAVVGAALGVSATTIMYIRKRNPDFPRPRLGACSAKITDDDVRAIRSEPGTCRQVGERYGISAASVHLIKKRRNWSHVKDAP